MIWRRLADDEPTPSGKLLRFYCVHFDCDWMWEGTNRVQGNSAYGLHWDQEHGRPEPRRYVPDEHQCESCAAKNSAESGRTP